MDPVDQLRSHFSGLRLHEETTAGRVYTGRDNTGSQVTIAVLAGPAATDQGARDAFADAVWRHSIGVVAGRATVTAADLHAVFPWAATRTPPGRAGAELLLAGVAPGEPVPAGSDRDAIPQSPPDSPEPTGGPAWPVTGAPEEPVSELPILPHPVPPARPAGWRSRLLAAGSPWPWLLGAASGVALVLLVVLVIGGVQWLRGAGPDRPAVTGTTAPPADQRPSPGGEAPPVRPAAPVSVVGPTFAVGDQTYPIALDGWPFAFRAPPEVTCFPERLDELPEGRYWLCRDQLGSGGQQLLAVFLWECPTTCTAEEQEQMARAWLDEPDQAIRLADSPTVYVEDPSNVHGLYSVDLATFTSERQGAPLRWLIGVYLESPFETRSGMQKILNDIVSQAMA